MSWDLAAGLDDRAALVTGGTGSIGREVVGAFAAAGARVAVADLDQAAVDAVVAELGDPARHVGLAVDLADPGAPDALVACVRETFGRLDVLAHLAATLRRQPDVEAISAEDWQAQDDVNLRATFFLNRAAARAMREHGDGGRIVNFVSQGWWTGGFGGSVVYAATKGGVVSMSRGLARTYGPDGILVNCVAPGAVDTPMLREGMSDEALEAFRAQIPLGRFADPRELAGAVVFLASRHASYISGAVLNISGGQLMY